MDTQAAPSWAGLRCKTGRIKKSRLGPWIPNLPFGLFYVLVFLKKFGEVSLATKRESREEFRAEVGEMMEKDLKKCMHIYNGAFWGTQAHLNNTSLVFQSLLIPKNLTLISGAESSLGAFNFIKFLWFLQWVIGPSGLKHCFYIWWGGRGIKSERNAGTSLHRGFINPFSLPASSPLRYFWGRG